MALIRFGLVGFFLGSDGFDKIRIGWFSKELEVISEDRILFIKLDRCLMK